MADRRAATRFAAELELFEGQQGLGPRLHNSAVVEAVAAAEPGGVPAAMLEGLSEHLAGLLRDEAQAWKVQKWLENDDNKMKDDADGAPGSAHSAGGGGLNAVRALQQGGCVDDNDADLDAAFAKALAIADNADDADNAAGSAAVAGPVATAQPDQAPAPTAAAIDVPGWDDYVAGVAGAPSPSLAHVGTANGDAALPTWVKLWDPRSALAYYHNNYTRTISWTVPGGVSGGDGGLSLLHRVTPDVGAALRVQRWFRACRVRRQWAPLLGRVRQVAAVQASGGIAWQGGGAGVAAVEEARMAHQPTVEVTPEAAGAPAVDAAGEYETFPRIVGDWEIHYDEMSANYYYYNTAKEITTWNRPQCLDEEHGAAAGASADGGAKAPSAEVAVAEQEHHQYDSQQQFFDGHTEGQQQQQQEYYDAGASGHQEATATAAEDGNAEESGVAGEDGNAEESGVAGGATPFEGSHDDGLMHVDCSVAAAVATAERFDAAHVRDVGSGSVASFTGTVDPGYPSSNALVHRWQQRQRTAGVALRTKRAPAPWR